MILGGRDSHCSCGGSGGGGSGGGGNCGVLDRRSQVKCSHGGGRSCSGGLVWGRRCDSIVGFGLDRRCCGWCASIFQSSRSMPELCVC